MKTTGGFAGFLDVLCLVWLTKQTMASGLLSAPEVVTASRGGSVTIPCQYDHYYRSNTKYWCRGLVYQLCTIVVKTPRNNRPSVRSSIADNKQEGVFTVNMTSLRLEDEDVYWCVISRHGVNIITRVQLLVSQTTTVAPTTSPPLTLKHDEICWWATLRWILFILMCCCLISTHIAVWRIDTAKNVPAAISMNNYE